MGLGLGSIMGSVVNPMTIAQLAMGPAGWASIIAKAIMSAVAQQVIQQVGQQLGLPQGAIDVAQQAFNAASGNAAGGLGGAAGGLGGVAAGALGRSGGVQDVVNGLAKQFNLNPSQTGELSRAARDFEQKTFNLADNLVKERAEKEKAASKKQVAEAESTGKKGNFLRRMAEALGAIADSKMDDMDKLSDRIAKQIHEGESITDKMNKIDKKDTKAQQANNQEFQTNQNKLGSLNALMQATTQELSILQNLIATALKSVGEAQSTLARKN